MDREILFRGKRKDNGEWFYGAYLPENSVILGYFEVNDLDTEHDIMNCQAVVHKVKRKTVGEYTDLTDRNGTKIFEGDIVSLKRFCDNYVGKIVFNSNTAGFEFWWDYIAGAYGEKATCKMNLSKTDEIEVIGNVHDNPELLEGNNDKK